MKVLSAHSCLPCIFFVLPCLMPPIRFSFFYYLLFLPKPISDTHGICHFFSVDFLTLHSSRLIFKILALWRIQFLIILCCVLAGNGIFFLSGWTTSSSFAWTGFLVSFGASFIISAAFRAAFSCLLQELSDNSGYPSPGFRLQHFPQFHIFSTVNYIRL